jgi:hypothetical protein
MCLWLLTLLFRLFVFLPSGTASHRKAGGRFIRMGRTLWLSPHHVWQDSLPPSTSLERWRLWGIPSNCYDYDKRNRITPSHTRHLRSPHDSRLTTHDSHEFSFFSCPLHFPYLTGTSSKLPDSGNARRDSSSRTQEWHSDSILRGNFSRPTRRETCL